jgi:hypothetical protein
MWRLHLRVPFCTDIMQPEDGAVIAYGDRQSWLLREGDGAIIAYCDRQSWLLREGEDPGFSFGGGPPT